MKRFIYLFLFLPLFATSQVKISELPSVISVNSADYFLVIQSGSSKKAPYSVFKYTEADAALQIQDSLDAFSVESTVAFGTNGQMPYVNSGGTNFLYSDNIKWNGQYLTLNTGTGNLFVGDNTGRVTTGIYNSFYGYRAGYSNTTGNNDVFIGYNSGYYNISGAYNTFAGSESGNSNVTGSNNSFYGYRSGYLNSSGGNNTFMGYRAGYSNVTGVNNTFNGYQAGYTNANGTENTFNGGVSGYSNTTGDSNTFNGYESGYSNTSGNNNTFNGLRSGYANITGGNNTFLGYRSGRFTNSSNNVFLGYESGYSNATGVDNAFIGYQSGYSTTSGSNNVYLGTAAGYLNLTGTGNVFLGDSAGYNQIGSDKLYISNNSTDTLIYGEFDNKLVTINGDLTVTGGIVGDVTAIPAGNDTEIQVNDGGVFGSSPNFTWNDTTLTIKLGTTNNVFIGEESGANTQAGSNNNTFLGYRSGYSNQLGDNNVFLGQSAGQFDENSTNNVIIGYQAGLAGGDVSNNVVVGMSAGYNNTGDGNIFLGYQAGKNEAGSNKLIIGNSTTSELIYGELDNNYVKINDSLEIAKSLKFSEAAVEDYSQGKLVYDTTDQALTFFNDISDFRHQLGYEHVVRFYNNTGSLITNGTLLRSTGAKVNGSVTFTANLAGNASLDSLQGIAMATTDVDDGTFGIATLIGQVNGLNTSMYNDNDLLWVGHAGGYENSSPEPPLWSSIFGRVLYADNDSGAVYMFPVGETGYSPEPAANATFTRETETIANPGQNVFANITNATNDLYTINYSKGFTSDGDSVRVLQDAVYNISLNYAFQGDAVASDDWRIGIFVNGVEIYSVIRTSSASNKGVVALGRIIALTTDDWITARIANTTNATRDAVFTDGSVNIQFISLE